MVRNRLVILLGVCFLTASAAWADNVGYIDCGGHPDETQVFRKARQTHDVVASLPCGERFTILQSGFIFSRIQTKDGQVGYVYSNVISPDHSGASVAQPTATRSSAATAKTPAPTTATIVQPSPAATPAQPQAAPVQPAPTQAPAPTPNLPSTAASVAQTDATTPTQTRPTSYQPASIQSPASIASVPETPATVVQPDATPSAQPEPTPAEAAAPAIRPASAKERWEQTPNRGVRTVGLRRMPLIELFGGYAFAPAVPGAILNGGMGSFGWNVKPWLQIVADTSYNFVTLSGTKTVLYGNHYGPRVFGRMRNRWGITPFVEGLIGASRADTTVSGTGGYSTSENTISFRVGGGLDLKPSRHFEIRLIDFDYYRTSFGTNVHQNNYWASTGIVIRLFGGSE
jgi:hypothetical protein